MKIRAKKFKIFLLFAFTANLTVNSFAQKYPLIYDSEAPVMDSTGVYTVIDSMPQYGGGYSKLYDYVDANINSSFLNRNERSRTYVSFIIDENGNPISFYIEKGSDKGLNKELLNVLSNMPIWAPGILNGENVKVRVTFQFYY